MTGMTDIGDWISETDVEGTWMDPAYMLRFWEQTRGVDCNDCPSVLTLAYPIIAICCSDFCS